MSEKESKRADNASASTRRSKSSHSSASSATVRARAKAEAAKTRAAFAEKEAELKIQRAELQLGKAKLEAELCALKHQREAAAAIAQAEALEVAELDQEDSIKTDLSSQANLQSEIVTRTNEYVEAQAEHNVERTQASAHATLPEADLSEGSYVTWNRPSERNLQLKKEQK